MAMELGHLRWERDDIVVVRFDQVNSEVIESIMKPMKPR